MGKASRHMFCEVEEAAAILGVEVCKVAGWLDGGRLKGTYVRGRWLAEITGVLRLHHELTDEMTSPVIARSGDRRCERISALNRRMQTDRHTPRRAKTERNLISEIEALCVVARPGLRPPLLRKKTSKEKLEARQRVDARIRAKEKEEIRRENARTYDRFCESRGDQTSSPGRSIAAKRYWWNEE